MFGQGVISKSNLWVVTPKTKKNPIWMSAEMGVHC